MAFICTILVMLLTSSSSMSIPLHENDYDFPKPYISTTSTLPPLVETSRKSSPKDVGDLFLSLGEKKTPLYLCNAFLEGIKYRLPKKQICSLSTKKEPSKAIMITFWWEDISKQPIAATECYAESVTYERYYTWYLTWDERVLEKESEYISPTDCTEMVKNRRGPDGRKLGRLREGFFGTSDFEYPDYVYTKTTTRKNVNYYFETMTITVSNIDETITSVSPLREICYASSGQCPTVLGIMVWTAKDYKACRIKEGNTTVCIRTGHRISCPDVNMALTKVTKTEICDAKVGYSEQGVYFTSTISEEFDSDVLSTKEARLKFGVSRRRREVRPSVDKEINAKFQFLYDMVAEASNYNVELFHLEMCRMSQVIMSIIRYLAESGNPTLLIHSLLGESSYRGRLNGDVLSLWRCDTITRWMFLPRENCSLEYPIRYVTSGHDQHIGYVTPLSHQIVHEATPTSCPPPNFYFDMGDNVILLANKSTAGFIPYLPTPFERSEGKLLPELSFKAPGIYTIEELTGQETITGMIRQMSNRFIVDNAIRAHQSKSSMSFGELGVIDGIQDIALEPIRKMLHWIFIIILILCLLGLFGYGIYYFQAIRRTVGFFVHVIGKAYRLARETVSLPGTPISRRRAISTLDVEMNSLYTQNNQYDNVGSTPAAQKLYPGCKNVGFREKGLKSRRHDASNLSLYNRTESEEE